MSIYKNPRRRVVADPHPALADATVISRFWSLVDRRSPDECWPWMGFIDKDGYGNFKWNGRRHGAHELALSFTTGEMRLPSLDTCHSCDNPPCVNPTHLRFDTRKSNVAEAVARGRMGRGGAKLTPEDVVLMRERRAAGARQSDLARDFGVSAAYVSELVRGLTWPELGGPIQEKWETRITK